MYLLIMHWKLFLVLISSHYVMGFMKNSSWKDHPHWKLIEKTYGKSSEIIDTNVDVGEPLILTPFLKTNQIKEARQAARVNETLLMPGIESYAGYLTVNEKHNGNLWFWYFPVQSKSVNETPLILWLQGGPGATSLYGLFQEIGPFTVTDNHSLNDNKYSWGKNHSLLFIDNPVGAGFSFTDMDGHARNQTTIGENLYTALQQFLTIFPELRTAPLFIAGESYAGKHIPSLGIQIHWHKNQDQPINLQGLSIGNGLIDPITILRYSYFLREIGVVDDKTADTMKSLETTAKILINNGSQKDALMLFGDILNMIRDRGNLDNMYNYLEDKFELHNSFFKFVQMPNMRRALHVGNTTFSPPGRVYYHLIPDIVNSAKPWLEELLGNYRVLVYSGHLDCMVPYHASVHTYMSLDYSGAKEYKNITRFPWYHNQILAGYYKTGGNLLEVMVRGAGHMVPIDKPAQALGLITAFIKNITLGTDTGDLIN